ncbi:MAG: hypothetical protein IJW31_03465 [Lentisphaeria bacterium]|nr:hypothetical protein [Lentisphaeria bacterium]
MDEDHWVNRIFKKLDELLFNFRGRASEDYEGSSHILWLPATAGFVFGIWLFINLYFLQQKGIDALYQMKIVTMAVWFVNELCLIKHVFMLPGLFRKLLYPVFVTIITVPVFLLLVYGTFWFACLIMFILVIIFAIIFATFLLSAAGGSSRSYSSPTPISTSSSSAKKDSRPEEVAYIDDGTPWGERITRKEGDATWSGSSGRYEKNWDDTYTKL